MDALICPGHVAAIIGADAFSFVPDELMVPAVVSGFEAYDIMAALLCIVNMLHNDERKCVNMYPRAVTAQGNKEALSLLYKVFEPCDASWRGIGKIQNSGLRIRDCYKAFDALNKFSIGKNSMGQENSMQQKKEINEAKKCICARILCGKNIPTDCPSFGKACTPVSPLGACMVSSEGSCAAYYHYNNV